MSTIDPGERGTLEIAHGVVRKVAERAAATVPGTAKAPAPPRIAGLGRGGNGAAVRVSGAGNDVDLALDLALHYPAPVRDVVDDVRSKVTGEVERITSYRVRALDVTVSALLPQSPSRVR
ncbi:Asp23/Gls24 family envelope stress response protein [Prauserella muralis]|uniref:Uncharacterized protein n=1 Tax=Prauserella muralis TaxID=588067 RepID=A0A2V4B1X3_9PSEU|nr:Asp23/Gls24 family envelope stress response protein [Prauserella muralis]PXY28204.1 hypothetical protein BAY60_17920 [Prauserella muralis]TWE21980.1 putative alkaline shock family protein YloU [Prauserella muralis]